MDIKSIFGTALKFVTDNKSSFLVGAGIVGLIGAGVYAVAKTPKAMANIEKAEAEKLDEKVNEAKENGDEIVEVPKLTAVETVKATWKCYAAPVAIGALSATSIILGLRDEQKSAALASAALQVSESKVLELDKLLGNTKKELAESEAFNQKAKTELGEKKVEKIEGAIESDRIISNAGMMVYDTGCGNELFWFPYGGYYIRSSKQAIKDQVKTIDAETDRYSSEPGSCMWKDALEIMHLPPMEVFGECAEFKGTGSELGVIFPAYDAPTTEKCWKIEFTTEPSVDY